MPPSMLDVRLTIKVFLLAVVGQLGVVVTSSEPGPTTFRVQSASHHDGATHPDPRQGTLGSLGATMQTHDAPFNMHFDAPGFLALYFWTGLLFVITLVYRLVMWGACRRDMVRERVSENQRENLLKQGYQDVKGGVYGTLATTYAATFAKVSEEVIDHGGRSGIVRKQVVYQFGYGYTFFGSVLYFFYMLWLCAVSATLLLCLLTVSIPDHFLWFANGFFNLSLCPESVWDNMDRRAQNCSLGMTDDAYMKANLGGVFLIFFVISFFMWLLYLKNSNAIFNFFMRQMSLREAEYVSIEERIVEQSQDDARYENEISRTVVDNVQVMVEDINGITYRYFVFQSTRLTYDHTAKIFAAPRNEVVDRNTLNALHLYKQEPLTVDAVSVDILLRGKNKIDVRVPSFFWFAAQELGNAVNLWQIFQAVTLAFFWQVAAGAVLFFVFLIQLYLAAMARKRVMQNVEQTARIQGIRLLVYRDERRDKYLEFGKPVDMSRMDLNRRANQRDTRHPTLSKIVEADDEESESEGSSMSDGHMLQSSGGHKSDNTFTYIADMKNGNAQAKDAPKDADGALAFKRLNAGTGALAAARTGTSTPSTSAGPSRDNSDSNSEEGDRGLQTLSGIQSLNARSKLRNGTFRSVHSAELVPGDLIEIPEGVVIPCDCVLLEGHALVNEADLTGEPMPVTKYPIERRGRAANEDRLDVVAHGKKHYLHCGTTVLQSLGSQRSKRNLKAIGLVVQTGTATMKGNMIRRILYPSPVYYRFTDQLGPFVFTMVFLLQLGSTIPLLVYGANDGRGFFQILVMACFEAISLSTQVASPLMLLGLTQAQQSAADRLKNSPSTTQTLSPERMIMAGEIKVQCLDKTGTITEEGLQLHGIRPVTAGLQPSSFPAAPPASGMNTFLEDSNPSSQTQTTPPISQGANSHSSSGSFSDSNSGGEGSADARTTASSTNKANARAANKIFEKKFEPLNRTLAESLHGPTVKFGPLVSVRDTPDQPMDKANLLEVAMATCHTVTKVDGNLYGNSVEREMVRVLNVDFAARIGEGVEYFRPKRHPGGGELLFKTVRQFEFDQGTQMQSVVVDMRGENARARGARNSRSNDSASFRSGTSSDASVHSHRSSLSTGLSSSLSGTGYGRSSPQHSHVLFSKGSFDAISKRCLPHTLPVDAEQLTKSLAVEGYYVIAIAYRPVDESSQNKANGQKVVRWHTSSRVDLETDMIFLGLIYFLNELKSDSAAAIAELRHGNVDPVMLTGDNLWTGIHVAEKVGMLPRNAVILGADVEKILDREGRRNSSSFPDELHWQFLRKTDNKHLPVWMNLLAEPGARYSSRISFFGTDVTGPSAAEARKRTGNGAFYRKKGARFGGAGAASDIELEAHTSTLYPTRGGEPPVSIAQAVKATQEGAVHLSPSPMFSPTNRSLLFEHFYFDGQGVDDRKLLRLIEQMELFAETMEDNGHAAMVVPKYNSTAPAAPTNALELAGLSDADDSISDACESERQRLLDRDLDVEGGAFPTARSLPRVSAQYRPTLLSKELQAAARSDDEHELKAAVRAPVAISSKRPKYYFALTEAAYRFLADHDPRLLEKIFPRVIVFGRMTPNGKVDVVRRTQSTGMVVGMCGDGGNDCGALRASHAGVALADGEASIVAPFSSTSKSLFAVVETIRQGRCCLRVSTALLEFHVIVGIASAIFKVAILSQKAYPSELMYLLKDSLVPCLIVTALVAATPPLHLGFKRGGWCSCCRREQWGTKNGMWLMLDSERPTGNLIAKPRLFLIVMAGLIFGSFVYLTWFFTTSTIANPWYHSIDLYALRGEGQLIAPWTSNLLSPVMIGAIVLFSFVVFVTVSIDGKFRNNVFSQCWVYLLLLAVFAPVLLIYFMCNSPIHALLRTNVDNMHSWQHASITAPATRAVAFSNADVLSPNFWFTRPDASLFSGQEDVFSYALNTAESFPDISTPAPVHWSSGSSRVGAEAAMENEQGAESTTAARSSRKAAGAQSTPPPSDARGEELLQRQVDQADKFMHNEMSAALTGWRANLLTKMDKGSEQTAMSATDFRVLFPAVGGGAATPASAVMVEVKTDFITQDATVKQWVKSLHEASQVTFADLRVSRRNKALEPLPEPQMIADIAAHACQKMCAASWTAGRGQNVPDRERFYCWWVAVSAERCVLMPRTDVGTTVALGPDYFNYVSTELLPKHSGVGVDAIYNTPNLNVQVVGGGTTTNNAGGSSLVNNVVLYPSKDAQEPFTAYQLNRHNVLSWRSQNYKSEGGYDDWLQEALPSFYPRQDFYMPRNGFTDDHSRWFPEVYENYPASFVPSFSMVFAGFVVVLCATMGFLTWLVLKFWAIGYEPPHRVHQFHMRGAPMPPSPDSNTSGSPLE
ncbi:unnamed protein product [Amoebophrya sp. A120]|nr:unnamed protein product [Amoebophrya sp. A120]|eukprot:GSA120T00012720001.1